MLDRHEHQISVRDKLSQEDDPVVRDQILEKHSHRRRTGQWPIASDKLRGLFGPEQDYEPVEDLSVHD